MDRGAWQATVCGVTKSWTDLARTVLEAWSPDHYVFRELPSAHRAECFLLAASACSPALTPRPEPRLARLLSSRWCCNLSFSLCPPLRRFACEELYSQ